MPKNNDKLKELLEQAEQGTKAVLRVKIIAITLPPCQSFIHIALETAY